MKAANEFAQAGSLVKSAATALEGAFATVKAGLESVFGQPKGLDPMGSAITEAGGFKFPGDSAGGGLVDAQGYAITGHGRNGGAMPVGVNVTVNGTNRRDVNDQIEQRARVFGRDIGQMAWG